KLGGIVDGGDQGKITLPAGAAAGRALEQRLRKSVDDRLQRRGARARGAAHLREQLHALAVQDLRTPLDHRREQLTLAAEVIAAQGNVDAGGVRDIAQGHAMKATLRKQPLGGVEDALPAGTGSTASRT